MRVLFLLLLAVACTPASACTEAVQKLSSLSFLFGCTSDPAKCQTDIADFCTGNGKNFNEEIKDVVQACGIAKDINNLEYALTLVGDLLCAKHESNYCISSLLNVLPVDQIIAVATNTSKVLDMSKQMQADILAKACTKPKCMTKMVKRVALLASQYEGKYQGTVQKYIEIGKSLAGSCTKNGDKFCAAEFKNSLTADGKSLDKTKVCDANGLKPCIRKALSRKNFGGHSIKFKDAHKLCDVDAKPSVKIGEIGLKLKNLLFTFYEKNEDMVKNALLADFSFLLPGVSVDDIELKIESDGTGIKVEVMIKEVPAVSIEIKTSEQLQALFKQFVAKTDDFMMPALDQLPKESRQSAEKLLSADAELQEPSVVDTPSSSPGTDTDKDEEASSAAVVGSGFMGVAMTAAAVFVL